MGNRVRESVPLSVGRVHVEDPNDPWIDGVLICGSQSKWGYPYLKEAWTPQTLAAYEGRPGYANHSADDRPERPVESKLCTWKNIRLRSDGQPIGDPHFNPHHPLTKSVLWAAEHNPAFYCVSHQSHVKWGTRNGRRVVEGIIQPISVDFVGDGATTRGLYEHAPPGGHSVPMTVKQYAAAIVKRSSIDFDKALKIKSLVREDGFGDAPMVADAPDPETGDEDGGIDAMTLSACTSLCQQVIDASGDPEVLKKALGKLKKVLMMHGEISTDDGSDDGEDDAGIADDSDDEDDVAHEGGGKKKKGPPVREGGDGALLDLIVREGFAPSDSQMAALKAISDPAVRVAFVREQKGLTAAKSAKSSGRGVAKESGGNATATESDGSWLLRGKVPAPSK